MGVMRTVLKRAGNRWSRIDGPAQLLKRSVSDTKATTTFQFRDFAPLQLKRGVTYGFRYRLTWIGTAGTVSHVVALKCSTSTGDDPTPPGDDPTPPGDDPTPPGDDPTPPGDDPTPPGGDPTPPGGDPTPPGGDPTPPGDEPPIDDPGPPDQPDLAPVANLGNLPNQGNAKQGVLNKKTAVLHQYHVGGSDREDGYAVTFRLVENHFLTTAYSFTWDPATGIWQIRGRGVVEDIWFSVVAVDSQGQESLPLRVDIHFR
jgi:hypothetical protein